MKKSYTFIIYIAVLFFIISNGNLIAGGNTKKTSTKEEYKVSDDNSSENYIKYENYTYDKNINTILLYKAGWELSIPLIQLNTDEKLQLSFDDFSSNIKNFKFTVIHCDADWKPSNMSVMDYLEGFNEDFITEYKFSFNTLQRYIHYEQTFPNDNMRITKSGNYILKVWEDNGNSNSLAFTRRFMVLEPRVNVTAIVKQATSVTNLFTKQEIEFTIINRGYPISNPSGDIKTVITQNERWDNAIFGTQPSFIGTDEIVYKYNELISFNGCNEFRHIDTKSLRYYTDRVSRIISDSNHYKVYLFEDYFRSRKTYITERDINGRMLIKNDDANNSAVESEYVWVYFSLKTTQPPTADGNLYVIGDFNNYSLNKQSLLKYNYITNSYEGRVYLKQGYYNYLYCLLRNRTTTPDETYIEGSFRETENEYTIYVYYREPGQFYDKLIAAKKISSLNQ